MISLKFLQIVNISMLVFVIAAAVNQLTTNWMFSYNFKCLFYSTKKIAGFNISRSIRNRNKQYKLIGLSKILTSIRMVPLQTNPILPMPFSKSIVSLRHVLMYNKCNFFKSIFIQSMIGVIKFHQLLRPCIPSFFP